MGGASMTTTEQETKSAGYADCPTQRIDAANDIVYAYRDIGTGDVPLVLLQHFRGNLANWDPALVDALGLKRIDLLGFSIGSFVAQEIALDRPDLLRRLVLASAAPQGAPGMHGWAPEVIGQVGEPEPNPQGYLGVFFAHSDTSRQAGQETAGRIFGKQTNQDVPTTWQTRQAQYDAVCRWGIPNHSLLQRVSAIELPVFVANGDSDPMILPCYSYLLAGLLPDARLKIYPDSAHGFLFQRHSRFAADVGDFLAAAG